MSAFLSGAFDAVAVADFFSSLGCRKSVEREQIRFCYCLACVFDRPTREANAERFIVLVKHTLGITNGYRDHRDESPVLH